MKNSAGVSFHNKQKILNNKNNRLAIISNYPLVIYNLNNSYKILNSKYEDKPLNNKKKICVNSK